MNRYLIPILCLPILAGCGIFRDVDDVGNADAGDPPDTTADMGSPPDMPLEDMPLEDAGSDAEPTDVGIDVPPSLDATADGDTRTPQPGCGDGVLDEETELCDDGNLLSHDGCSSGCLTEVAAWTELSDGPSARISPMVEYHGVTGSVELFGGETGNGFEDGHWYLDGDTWRQRSVETPSRRSAPAHAYDHDQGVLLLVGGQGPEGTMNDHWEFDGTQWQTPPGAVFPDEKLYGVLAYGGGRFILAGGYQMSGVWERRLGVWRELSPSQFSGLGGPAFTYDATRQQFVLHGGMLNSSREDATYTLNDGEDLFDEVMVADKPPAKWAHQAVWDPRRERVVMFGGFDGPGDRTWEWDGNNWNELSTADAPPGRELHGMTYDVEGARIVVFGGTIGQTRHGDTWVLRWSSPTPDEVCSGGQDEDEDGAVDCADPDCDGRRCESGVCISGSCETFP